MSILVVIFEQLTQHPFQMLAEMAITALIALLYLQSNIKKKAAAREAKRPKPVMPSLEEQERRLAAYRSTPFHADSVITSNVSVPDFQGMLEVVGREGCHVTVKGGAFKVPTECLDLATYDYHSFSTHPKVMEVARKSALAYGVGSCGPRGFYGTMKPHMQIETDLAEFLGTEDAVVYSFSYATISTLISCYASKGDYLICDESVCAPVLEGCVLCRCNLIRYRHNDMAHLEEMIKEVVAKEDPRKPHRRFVVTEGVFRNSGDLCNLPEVMRLCEKYKFRTIVDDSYGFGAIGKTGRGTPEHFGIATADVDVYVGSLSTSLGAVGGFCAGNLNMTDFQRLGAAAYVFSASLPPYVTASASASLKVIGEEPQHVADLARNAKLTRGALRAAKFNPEKITLIESDGDASPLVVLRVADEYVREKTDAAVQNQLQRVINAAEKANIVLLRSVYTTEEEVENKPSLRIMVKGAIPEVELKAAVETIISAIKSELA